MEQAALGRIVILSDFSWSLGGAEEMALLNARMMADAGLPVTLIAGDDGKKCPLDLTKIELIALGGAPLLERSIFERGANGLFNRAALKLIEEFIARRDTPDTVYHLHNWSQIFSPAVFQALKPVASRLFVSAHDFSLVCPNLSYSNFQKGGKPCTLKPLSAACLTTHCDRRYYSHKLWRSARSLMLRQTWAAACAQSLFGIIHPSMAEQYERGGLPRERQRVLRNPVNPFSQTRIKAEENSDVFFIGRVVQEKGVDLAAEAARMAGRRLRVIGDGEMRAQLAERYPEVAFEGRRPHHEIAELIKDARAVLVTSRLPEAFTLVAHECMRSGLPVIAFSDVDCQEMADLGGALVVPPREPSNLAAALRQLDDDAVTARISQTAFKEAWRFSNTADTWRDALLGHYREMVSAASVESPESFRQERRVSNVVMVA